VQRGVKKGRNLNLKSTVASPVGDLMSKKRRSKKKGYTELKRGNEIREGQTKVKHNRGEASPGDGKASG